MATVWVIGLALVKLTLHIVTSHGYGYFRDEFYYMDAGMHLGLGYVDFPPLAPFLAAAIRVTTGYSLLTLRLLPAVAGAAVVLLTGLMARELGGGPFAQALAALAAVVSPILLAVASFFSMNPFEQLCWALLAYLAIRLLRRGHPRVFLLGGLVAGIGLLTKASVLAFVFALLLGLLLTPARRLLWSRWFWLGVAIAGVLVLPTVIWQCTHGWPTLEFLGHYRRELVNRSPLGFVFQQVFGMNPAAVPLAVAALVFYLVSKDGRPYRALGWAYVALCVVLMATQAKAYALTPTYPMLFAGGAPVLERAWSTGRWRLARPLYIGLLLALGVFFAPVCIPLLPIETLATTYAPAMDQPAIRMEQAQRNALPEWFAGRLGWQEMVAAVSRVYGELPTEERAGVCLLAGTYGEAGALNFYGVAYGLPPAISGHKPTVCRRRLVGTIPTTSGGLGIARARWWSAWASRARNSKQSTRT
jgi:4-amino-4-deoxy-L-arabinose transferase-like glycosyltransferase